MSSVFVIMNEWIVDSITASAVAGSAYFASEQEAWFALREIAHSYNQDIDYDDSSFAIEKLGRYADFEEYYIQELTKK